MLSKSKSFGLIETLIACGILVMAAGATTGLGVLSIHGTVIAKHKTEAYMIAQGAMERIKGARDQVWENWNTNTGGPVWDRFWNNSPDIDGNDNEFNEIKINLEGKCVFINHDTGALTEAACTTNPPPGLKFQRFITKDAVDSSGIPSGNIYKVTVRVEWSDYGQTQSVSLVSYLTNWKPRY